MADILWRIRKSSGIRSPASAFYLTLATHDPMRLSQQWRE